MIFRTLSFKFGLPILSHVVYPGVRFLQHLVRGISLSTSSYLIEVRFELEPYIWSIFSSFFFCDFDRKLHVGDCTFWKFSHTWYSPTKMHFVQNSPHQLALQLSCASQRCLRCLMGARLDMKWNTEGKKETLKKNTAWCSLIPLKQFHLLHFPLKRWGKKCGHFSFFSALQSYLGIPDCFFLES